MANLETLEKSVEQNIPEWRIKAGLHPTEEPSNLDDDRFINCHALHFTDQIKLCQDRIFQQQRHIADLAKNAKGDGRDKAIAIAQRVIAEEVEMIGKIAIAYAQSNFQSVEQGSCSTPTPPPIYPGGSGYLSYDENKQRWLFGYKLQVWDESKKAYAWRSRTKHVAKHLVEGVRDARAQGKTVVEILRLI